MAKQKVQDEQAIERNIYQRCGGYSFRVRMNVCGVRVDETFDSLDEARAFRDRKRSDLVLDPTAKLVLLARSSKREVRELTLGVLLDRYDAEVTEHKKGVRAERLRIRKLKRFEIATLPAQLIDRTDLYRFMEGGKKELWSSSTLRKYVMLISAVYTTAVKRWGHDFQNPVRKVEVPSNGVGRNRRLEAGEYERILDSLCCSRSIYMAPLFILAVETAARRGELLKLDWRNVDLAGGTAQLLDTKNGEDRFIPLSPAAKRALQSLPRGIAGRVFPLAEFQVRGAFETGVKRARKRYEIECTKSGISPNPNYLTGLRFHDLRHEATTRLFERGFDMMEAASVTGHKTLSMLKRYTHLRAEDLAKKLG